MYLRGWLMCAVLMAQPALSATHAENDRLRAWKITAVAVLSARSDANSVATAAMLSPAAGPELAARASELAPDSAPLAWVHLRLCAITPGCDIRAAATAMRWVAADNPAAWLPTLGVAQRERDTVEIERILVDMSQGGHFEVYAIPVAVLMFDALKAVAASLPRSFADNDASRLALVIGVANAKLVPTFAAIEEVCRESAALPSRHESCQKIARKLQRGDTVSGELAGLAIEKHAFLPESKEAHAISERRHLLEWQAAAAARFDEPLLPWLKKPHARWHLARMRTLHREQDVVLAILREQGTSLSGP
jgi:hypothetical protein